MSETLISARGLSCSFPVKRGLLRPAARLRAVDGVDLEIGRGEALGVVGESGCGKSTLGRLLIGLLEPTAGTVVFDGTPLAKRRGASRRALRRRLQMIFQDPYGSLDPRRRVGDQIADGLKVHAIVPAAETDREVARLLDLVGLDPGAGERLPHAFSGGQRQRIATARALASRPDFIVADEPVSALDVSIQAQVVNLLADLRADLGLALLFISHDLHVVRHLCDRVVVMYLGRVVEEGPAKVVCDDPAHPYTRALLEATPSMRRRAAGAPLEGELPDPTDPPSGCPFHTRCPIAEPACVTSPPLSTTCGPARRAACIKPLVGR